MEAPHSQDGDYWGTLINADKSAAPLLEQLCLGLVQLMVKILGSLDIVFLPSLMIKQVQFESSHGSSCDLTPDKLARFYRQVGGNYDALFLETKGPALSFIYQALGCFHTLQPTKNPYEAPSIPALLPMGFVRWQVIQILLCPDEHSLYIQDALCRWDVPNPAGGTFPKVIPRTAFPETADADMLRWHERVSRRLEKDHAHWNTPQPRTSPAEANSRNGGDASSYRRTYFDTDDETLRQHHRRRSQDAQRSRLHRFETDLDGWTGSRNPSPAQPRSSSAARMPMRSKTTRPRNNREYPEKASAKKDKKTKERKQPYRKQRPEPLSESSDDEDGVFPRRRRGSIDERRPRRSSHLSPSNDAESQRRHSHDASYYKTRDRGYHTDYNNNNNNNNNKRDSSRYPPSKMKFYENMFDEPVARPSRDANSTLPYEIKESQIPRVHVRSDGTPVDAARGSTLSNGSGSSSSDRDRPRSSSGPASWVPWKSASRAGTRKVPVYD
ncbi:uncharacterized protein TRUGW13939_11709 [Talaromyces rugulosus]|uniref:DUF7514 domain-containing protein n=1 Tax=Talaromyces rugulosus TaxID=121627 RepID=A0A7H8RDM8_TALRU|nr:uncharacterized protein TRUGW13939_11709 [Talaromyces rugulosus]QKX64534.1 hypothetical protein TRUGW13939_11709 [Talaromyces rugulosus]